MPKFEALVMCAASLWLTVSSSKQGQCAKFIINHPFIFGNKMYIEKNTALNFSFSLILGDKCNINTLSQIEVIKNHLDTPQERFFINNTACQPTGRNRSCTIGHRELKFFTMINPSSEINSTWTFNHQNAPTLSLQFVTTSLPRVLNVKKTTEASSASMSEVVPAGSAVFIHCLWDNGGRPEVQPQQIFLNSNKTVEPIFNTRNLTVYLLQNVSCDDAGTVKCSTEENNMSAALLVACAPNFGNNTWLNMFFESNSLPTDLAVNMPTDRITSCTLRPQSPLAFREKNCTRNVTAYGDPPFLRLNLSLLRLDAFEVGVWELCVTNAYGPGRLFIYASSEKSSKDENPSKEDSMAWAIPLGGVFLIVIIIILVKVLYGFRKEQTRDKATAVSDVILPPLYRGSNVSINISNDLYVKLPDVSSQQSPLLPCDANLFGKGDYPEIRPPMCGYGGGEIPSQKDHVDSPLLIEQTKKPLQKVSKTVVSNLYVSAEEVRRNRRSTENLNARRS